MLFTTGIFWFRASFSEIGVAGIGVVLGGEIGCGGR